MAVDSISALSSIILSLLYSCRSYNYHTLVIYKYYRYEKKINRGVSAFWHPLFFRSGCTMISEPDASPNWLHRSQHVVEVCGANLNPVKGTVVLDGNPIPIGQFGKAAHFAVMMDLTGDALVDWFLKIRHNSSLPFRALLTWLSVLPYSSLKWYIYIELTNRHCIRNACQFKL